MGERGERRSSIKYPYYFTYATPTDPDADTVRIPQH
jgi:hypothetical protein